MSHRHNNHLRLLRAARAFVTRPDLAWTFAVVRTSTLARNQLIKPEFTQNVLYSHLSFRALLFVVVWLYFLRCWRLLLLLTPVAWFLSPRLPWLWRLAFTGATVATLSRIRGPFPSSDWSKGEAGATSSEKWLADWKSHTSVCFTGAQATVTARTVVIVFKCTPEKSER